MNSPVLTNNGNNSNSKNFECLREFDGILVPGGFGSRGSEGIINSCNFARVNDVPFLGICFGFQLAIVEFARNVCKLTDANSTEINSKYQQSRGTIYARTKTNQRLWEEQ